MGGQTSIEWTDHTFNPWIGCQAVSGACDHCYAETLVQRWGGDFSTRRRTAPLNWRQPLLWNRKAQAAGVRGRVFCASLADVFDNQVPPEWRYDLWDLIRVTPWLDWQLLTKRPMNILRMLPPDWGLGWPNVWLGTTAEDQDQLALRAWSLALIPTAFRFLSYEPALGPVNTRNVTNRLGTAWDSLSGRILQREGAAPAAVGAISWVICGGESGPRSRPMHPVWARSLRDQCAAAGVPFFFKQWGDWQPEPDVQNWAYRSDQIHFWSARRPGPVDQDASVRVGKKTAGGLLDGLQHRNFPKYKGDRGMSSDG